MNEQIFKLALKAMDFQGAVDIDTELKLTNSELTKFAELIVKEMLDITDAHTKVFHTDQDKVFIEYIKQSVKQHFGVEE